MVLIICRRPAHTFDESCNICSTASASETYTPCFFTLAIYFLFANNTATIVTADPQQAAASKRGGAKSKKFELTEEQKQEIREAFDLFDTDGSGKERRRR